MPVSEAHMRATSKFETSAYKKVGLRIRKDKPDASGISYDDIKDAADAAGQSLNVYILQAVKERIDRDNITG